MSFFMCQKMSKRLANQMKKRVYITSNLKIIYIYSLFTKVILQKLTARKSKKLRKNN